MSVKDTILAIYSDSKDSKLHSKLEDHGKNIGGKIGSFLGYYFGYGIEKTIFGFEYILGVLKDFPFEDAHKYLYSDKEMKTEETESR